MPKMQQHVRNFYMQSGQENNGEARQTTNKMMFVIFWLTDLMALIFLLQEMERS